MLENVFVVKHVHSLLALSDAILHLTLCRPTPATRLGTWQPSSCRHPSTPLHEAAHKSSFAIAKLLLDAGADVNAQDTDGETPLHKAIRGDHMHAAWGLMSNGADIFIKNKRGIDAEGLAKLRRADYDTMQMFADHKKRLEEKQKTEKHDEL